MSEFSGRLFQRVIVQKEMPVITGIHLSVPFIKQGMRTWGVSVRSSTAGKRLEANRRNENKSMETLGGRRCSAKGRRRDWTRSCLGSSGFFAVYVLFFSGHGFEFK